jgi:RNA polymerase sigma-70 factor (ECF subfamily)
MVIDHDDANDVLQNVLSGLEGLENFREDSQLYTWLYSVATISSDVPCTTKEEIPL